MQRRNLLKTSVMALLASSAGMFVSAQETPQVREMILGNPEASVEVIEYASYTCPHCANFHADQYKKLKENYIDTGKVKFIFREIYFNRFDLWASVVARCAGEDRFFGLTEVIFANQRDWTSGQDPAKIANDLRNIGKVAGLDDTALDACFKDSDNAEALVAWFQENAERDDITSTPSFLINGEKFSNMSYEDFAKILDEKLAEL